MPLTIAGYRAYGAVDLDPPGGGGEGGDEITHGFQVTSSNTGHTAYFDSGLGRNVTDADLTVHTGTVYLSSFVSEGGTLRKHWFQGDVNMNVANVTLEACKFDIGVQTYQAGVVLNYCTIDTVSGASDNGIYWNDYTIYRCRVGGGADGAKVNGNCHLIESYIRTKSKGSGDHNDGLQCEGATSGSEIVRCNIDSRPVNGGGAQNAVISVADSSVGTYEIHDNYLQGGGFVLRIVSPAVCNVTGNWILSGSYEYDTHDGNASGDWSDNWLVDSSGTQLSSISK